MNEFESILDLSTPRTRAWSPDFTLPDICFVLPCMQPHDCHMLLGCQAIPLDLV